MYSENVDAGVLYQGTVIEKTTEGTAMQCAYRCRQTTGGTCEFWAYNTDGRACEMLTGDMTKQLANPKGISGSKNSFMPESMFLLSS